MNNKDQNEVSMKARNVFKHVVHKYVIGMNEMPQINWAIRMLNLNNKTNIKLASSRRSICAWQYDRSQVQFRFIMKLKSLSGLKFYSYHVGETRFGVVDSVISEKKKIFKRYRNRF